MPKHLRARLLSSLALLLPSSFIFSQPPESEIKLPQVVTYIPASLENKISFYEEKIQRLHVQDLPDLLQTAGVQLLSYGTYGMEQKPSIRGFTDETVRVVIDGVCVNNAQTGSFDFSTISLDNIEHIDIIKGGFTEGTDDEGAVGGAIYITTKKQINKAVFNSDTSLKSFFNFQSPLDTVSQSLNFSAPLAESLFMNTGAKVTHAENKYERSDKTDSRVTDGQANFQITKYFGNGNSFSASDLFYGGYKHTPGPLYAQLKGIQQDYNNNLAFSLFTPNLSPIFTVKNNLTWLSNNRLYKDNSENSRHNVNSIKYNTSLDFYSWHNFKQTAGLTFDYTNLNSTNDGTLNLFTGTFKSTTKYAFNKIFTLSIPWAVKFSGKNFAFVPKIGVSASFKYLTVSLDGYKMVQFPTMDDLYWQGTGFSGNPDLIPESGWGADFNLNFTNEKLPATISFFTNYYENKIQWAASSGTWKPENVASAFYFGIDFSFSLNLFENIFKLEGNGEYLYTRLMDKTNQYTYGKQIMWTPDFTGSLTASLNLKPLHFAIESNYVGIRYTSNMNLYYLKPYVLINIVTEITALDHVKPYLRADNILNTKYESIENYPMPGASLTAGFKMTF